MCVCVCGCVCLEFIYTSVRRPVCYWHWSSPHDHTSSARCNTVKTFPMKPFLLCYLPKRRKKVESVLLSLSESLFKTLAILSAACYDVKHPGRRKCAFSQMFHGYSNSRFLSQLYKINFNDFSQTYTLICKINTCTNV